MKKALIFFFVVFLSSCGNKSDITGKTSKGDLKSPCVGNENSPCTNRFNPNYAHKELRPFIS